VTETVRPKSPVLGRGRHCGSYRIKRFPSDFVSFPFSGQVLQKTLDQFVAAYNQAGMKIITKETEVYVSPKWSLNCG